MTKRFLFLTIAAAAIAALLGGAASARVEAGTGAAGPALRHSEVEAEDAAEATGTATSDGPSITVTRPDGTSIACAVPTGLDVTPFLSGNVKVECDDVNGVLTLREIASETGARAEIGDDGTIESEADEDNSGPGNADDRGEDESGPGNADDDPGDDGGHGDNNGHGGGDHGGSGHSGGGGDD